MGIKVMVILRVSCQATMVRVIVKMAKETAQLARDNVRFLRDSHLARKNQICLSVFVSSIFVLGSAFPTNTKNRVNRVNLKISHRI